MNPLWMMLGGYAAGSVPTGVWLGKVWKGIDVRQHGSRNLGATNVFRVLGKGPGIATLLIDMLKGLLPVLLARTWYPGETGIIVGVGVSAILGHMTSPFVGFKGGKGVATSTGVFAALLPGPALAAVLTFGVVLAASRYVSLGSILSAIVLVVVTWLSPVDMILKYMATGITALVIWMHRSNIERLRAGTESRVFERKSHS